MRQAPCPGRHVGLTHVLFSGTLGAVIIIPTLLFFFFFVTLHGMRCLRPNQGSDPCLLQWKRAVLTTGPPGKSLIIPTLEMGTLRPRVPWPRSRGK